MPRQGQDLCRLPTHCAVVLAGGGALAVVNKACKSGHHPWVAPARTHVKDVGTHTVQDLRA
jgi:hypothetical protein